MENSLSYVNCHDWGSFEKNSTIKKLLLRDKEDFDVYFDTYLTKIFCKPTQQNFQVLTGKNEIYNVSAKIKK